MILVSVSVLVMLTLVATFLENDEFYYRTVSVKHASSKGVVNAANNDSAASDDASASASSDASEDASSDAYVEKYGLNILPDGHRYFLNKNGKRATGYKKVGSDEYYFAGSKGYAITKKWKYVKLNGIKYKLYFGANGKRKKNVSSLMKSNARYYVEVLLDKNMVMIYAKDGSKGYTIPVNSMICSTGMEGHRTITGTYSLYQVAPWRMLFYNSTGQYATNIHGNILFHSVVYTRYGDHYSLDKAEYNKLGKSASHGCVRLTVKDAKWIYDHVPNIDKATLRYTNAGEKFPLDKPKKKKIGKTKAGKYYDPTDPKCK